jgi:hypothetical protein
VPATLVDVLAASMGGEAAEAYARKLAETTLLLNAREEKIISLSQHNAELEESNAELSAQVCMSHACRPTLIRAGRQLARAASGL